MNDLRKFFIDNKALLALFSTLEKVPKNYLGKKYLDKCFLEKTFIIILFYIITIIRIFM